jgi:hypothetical protein
VDIDIRDMDDTFQYCLEEFRTSEDRIVSDFGLSTAKKGYRYMGAGTGLHFAATGFKTFSVLMGNAWRNNDDDLGAVPTKAVDADDMRTYMSLGRDPYNASVKSTSNSFGTAGTPALSPAVETIA